MTYELQSVPFNTINEIDEPHLDGRSLRAESFRLGTLVAACFAQLHACCLVSLVGVTLSIYLIPSQHGELGSGAFPVAKGRHRDRDLFRSSHVKDSPESNTSDSRANTATMHTTIFFIFFGSWIWEFYVGVFDCVISIGYI